jgi:hypothetical protein
MATIVALFVTFLMGAPQKNNDDVSGIDDGKWRVEEANLATNPTRVATRLGSDSAFSFRRSGLLRRGLGRWRHERLLWNTERKIGVVGKIRAQRDSYTEYCDGEKAIKKKERREGTGFQTAMYAWV